MLSKLLAFTLLSLGTLVAVKAFIYSTKLTKNYCKKTTAAVNPEAFIEGQIYETYQGFYAMLQDDKLMISSTRSALPRKATREAGDLEEIKVNLRSEDLHVKSIIVDFDSCISESFDGVIDSTREKEQRVVQIVDMKKTSFWGTLSRTFLSDYRINQLFNLSAKPRKISWNEFLDGNNVYGISIYSHGSQIGGDYVPLIDLAYEWATSHIPQKGDVRSAVLFESASLKQYYGTIQCYRQDWADKRYSPCGSEWIV